MIKRLLAIALTVVMSVSVMTGCSNGKNDSQKAATEKKAETTAIEETTAEEKKASLEDGVYEADFTTDSSMFHVNEAKEGKGELTVKNGEMTIHISLVSKKIVNLFVGLAEDAKKDGAQLLQPTTDTVTYSDGMTEEVFGFDVPVEAIDKEFDLAILGESGRWFDHKVSVSNPVLAEDKKEGTKVSDLNLDNGSYTAEVKLEGGSGRAGITSPCEFEFKDGQVEAKIEWSSPNYDFMMVNDEKYLPVNEEGNSVFVIPVEIFDAPVEVSADTTAMSKPYLIDYTLEFNSDTIAAK